jgi:hypothetical protein
MLGGMRSLPDDGWSARGDGSGVGPLDGVWRPLGTVRHSFTHFDLELQLMLYSGGNLARLAADKGEWWRVDQLEEAGLPTLFAKAARLALAIGLGRIQVQQSDLTRRNLLRGSALLGAGAVLGGLPLSGAVAKTLAGSSRSSGQPLPRLSKGRLHRARLPG